VNRGISGKMPDFFRHLDGQYGKYYRMMDSEKGYVFQKSVEKAKENDWGKKKKSHKVMHRALAG